MHIKAMAKVLLFVLPKKKKKNYSLLAPCIFCHPSELSFGPIFLQFTLLGFALQNLLESEQLH